MKQRKITEQRTKDWIWQIESINKVKPFKKKKDSYGANLEWSKACDQKLYVFKHVTTLINRNKWRSIDRKTESVSG